MLGQLNTNGGGDNDPPQQFFGNPAPKMYKSHKNVGDALLSESRNQGFGQRDQPLDMKSRLGAQQPEGSSYFGRKEEAVSSSLIEHPQQSAAEDDMLLPPKSSLVSMSLQGEAVTEQSGMRQRHTGRLTGASQGGLDLGSPRGLDLNSPMRLGNRVNSHEMGVTAAVELIAVKTPWVTVFGYPQGAGFNVLQFFQKFGEVHEHRQSGNWMHILYSSKLQASRALAQNGISMTINDSPIMIGVKACSDPAMAEVSASSTSHKSSQRFSKPQAHQVQHTSQQDSAPRRASNMCKRFWSWVLDI
mmetsp:Transcript_23944/g.42207  ORF Transcript_23944/g.42207 Transcript_23944/m.42207 type:complete len:301 (+) Transcript_23944:232-1134(+)